MGPEDEAGRPEARLSEPVAITFDQAEAIRALFPDEVVLVRNVRGLTHPSNAHSIFVEPADPDSTSANRHGVWLADNGNGIGITRETLESLPEGDPVGA